MLRFFERQLGEHRIGGDSAWRSTETCGNRGEDGKLPLHWFDVPSRSVVSFAGVWRPTERGVVFAFLTCEPNPLIAPIHPKAMPVLLAEEDEAKWLECD